VDIDYIIPSFRANPTSYLLAEKRLSLYTAVSGTVMIAKLAETPPERISNTGYQNSIKTRNGINQISLK
jgi:hypothetical protein